MKRPEYMGYTVNFRTTSKSYKEKKNIINTPDKWAVFENTQEAIVDSETWHLAQKLIGTPRRSDTIGEANPLTGLVFCADCGAKMYNHRSRPYTNQDGRKIPGFDGYDCSTHKLSTRRVEGSCCSHHISTKALRELILYTIREVSRFAIADRETFMKKVQEASAIQQEQSVKLVIGCRTCIRSVPCLCFVCGILCDGGNTSVTPPHTCYCNSSLTFFLYLLEEKADVNLSSISSTVL